MASDPLLQSVASSVEHLRQTVEKQGGDIASIKDSMTQILVIEERQSSQKDALARLGRHVDRHDEEISGIKEKVNGLLFDSGITMTKLGVISAGIAILASGTVALVVKLIST